MDVQQALARLRHESAVLVTVLQTRGSVPRGRGTAMLVFADDFAATIGGGHSEWQALAHARALLSGQPVPLQLHQALGPSLGQCCGGALDLGFERVSASDLERVRAQLDGPRVPLALFGGGHVGRALVDVLAPLPFEVRWIDSRDGIFPPALPATVQCEHSEPVQAAVADLVPGSHVLIMSFSHAEDLDIVMACLRRCRQQADLPYVGLIGSKTKWATFRHRLIERGFEEQELAQVTSPIGIAGIAGKSPEVIAVAVAAQLLQRLPPDLAG